VFLANSKKILDFEIVRKDYKSFPIVCANVLLETRFCLEFGDDMIYNL